MTAIKEHLVAGIRVPKRLLPLKEANVETLVESIRERGLIYPITVTMGDYIPYLVAGHHRLEAFKRLGKEMIPCIEVEGDDAACRLVEIDENLARQELTPAERAILVDERKRLYEMEHPETVHGVNQHTGDGRSRPMGDSSGRFTAETAKVTGRSERSVQKDATRGKRIGPERLRKVIGTSLDKPVELDALGEMAQRAPAEATALVERAASGEDVTARKDPVAVSTGDGYEALMTAWLAADQGARDRFLQKIGMARAA